MKPSAPASWPETCARGSDAPWCSVFAELRAALMRKGWTNNALAEEICEVRAKDLSAWSAVAYRKFAPLWAIRRFCLMLGVVIVIFPDEIRIVPVERVRDVL